MKLPRDLSGGEFANLLVRWFSYQIVRTRGSHMTLTRTIGDKSHQSLFRATENCESERSMKLLETLLALLVSQKERFVKLSLDSRPVSTSNRLGHLEEHCLLVSMCPLTGETFVTSKSTRWGRAHKTA